MALPRHRTATRSLLLLATAMLALRSRKADAFFPTNALTFQGFEGRSHEKITTDALEALDGEFFGGQSPNGSMRAANQEIAEANIDVDDDQLHSSLHFDGENFAVGQGRLLGLKQPSSPRSGGTTARARARSWDRPCTRSRTSTRTATGRTTTRSSTWTWASKVARYRTRSA